MNNHNKRAWRAARAKYIFLQNSFTIFHVSFHSGKKGLEYCRLMADYMKDVHNTVCVMSTLSRWLKDYNVSLRVLGRWCVRKKLFIIQRDKNIMYSPKSRRLLGLPSHPSEKEIMEAIEYQNQIYL